MANLALTRPILSLALALPYLACAPSSSDVDTTDQPADDPAGAPRMCTEIGCADQATITMTLTRAEAPTGTHTFEVTLDDVAQTCTLELGSSEGDGSGERASTTCSGGAELRFGPVTRGVEQQLDGMVAYTEVPVPGQWQWTLSAAGTPTTAHVVHRHAGELVLDQTATFQYTEHRPNGEGCEPVCKAASVTWTGP